MFLLLIPGVISPSLSRCASTDDCQWEPGLRRKESRFPFPPNILSPAGHPRVPALAQDQRLSFEEGAGAERGDLTQPRQGIRRTLVTAPVSLCSLAAASLLPYVICLPRPPRLANPIHFGEMRKWGGASQPH